MTVFVSGPINLVRLEGVVDNQKKVFYIYFDVHNPIKEQSECVQEGIHIRDYFTSIFQKLSKQDNNKKLDFFLEALPDTSSYKNKSRGIYLRELRTMFEEIFRFKFEENKVLISKEFPKIRLHYLDVRAYLSFSSTGKPAGLIEVMDKFLVSFKNDNLNEGDISKLKDGISILDTQLAMVHDAFFDGVKNVEKVPIIRKVPQSPISYIGNDALKTFNYLINKIKNVYAHKDVKETMNKLMKNELKDYFDEYYKAYDKLMIYIDDKPTIKPKALDEVFGDYHDSVLNLYALLMDFYCLRRILDKDYVTTGIIYTGALHSSNYVRLLVNYFDFKITHVYYSKIPIKEIHKKIKGFTTDDLMDIFVKPDAIQCIDVSKFPPNFE